MRKTRKGFTLVELLIVIAILGALASMMTLSGANSTASANATKIINNLQTMKAAVYMFLTDYVYSEDADFAKLSDDYFDAATLKELRSDYGLAVKDASDTDPKKWYAGYKFKTEADAAQIKKILASRAEKTALYPGTALATAPTAETSYYKDEAVVFVRVR